MVLKSDEHREYIKLHYSVLQKYRVHYKYIPFTYIHKRIKRKWSVMQYNKIMEKYDTNTPKTQTIRWSDNI